MRFLHITDLHFLNQYPQVESGYDAIFKKMTHPIKQLKAGLKKIDLTNLDAIIITGDLTECGSEADYRQLRVVLEEIFKDVPILVTLGNHDVKAAFYKGWLNQSHRCEPYHTVTKIKDVVFVGLDNSDEVDQTGILDQERCSWLATTLEQYRDEQVIVFCHHHMISSQATIPSIRYHKQFEQIIKESTIMAMICGHTHHAYRGSFAGKPYFTADNLSFSGEDEGDGIVRFEERSGFNECVVEACELIVEEISALDHKTLLTRVDFKR
ncbi:MAG: metallophosphoesterase family protein [Cellulosilyticaceae bacterium]